MFINDKFKNGKPAQGNKSNWQNTKIASNVYIGSNSTILPVKICSNVVIGAGSVVTKDISKPGNYAGNPAKDLMDLKFVIIYLINLTIVNFVYLKSKLISSEIWSV